MSSSAVRDLVVGLFVVAGLAAIGYLSVQVGGLNYKGEGGLVLVAHFDDIGGLTGRAPVSVAGVTVGQVKAIQLDDLLRAEVTLDLDPGLELPTDTSVAIRTAGILGDQFLALEPGAEEEFLRSGDEIAYTEDALSLERLIGKFVNNAGLE
ncbi:MAG: outer membrane lipid asymmetry maintenance protein MlaD [Myxococcales bacterium]|nr:outer membrane lipid asymmetry maintenance protein MlaD [Myxococcales bacterium]